MSTAIQSQNPPTFNIGTTSSSVMDRSLDDLIKARKADEKKNKAIGTGKAKRNAKIAAKRGTSTSSKPTAMEVENEVYRQQRKQSNNNNTNPSNNSNSSKQSNRLPRREGDLKVKQKNIAAKKKETGTPTIRPPTRKALAAARKALTDAGYIPPPGMKMVVTFTPSDNKANISPKTNKPENKNQQTKQNNNSQSGKQQQQQQKSKQSPTNNRKPQKEGQGQGKRR